MTLTMSTTGMQQRRKLDPIVRLGYIPDHSSPS